MTTLLIDRATLRAGEAAHAAIWDDAELSQVMAAVARRPDPATQRWVEQTLAWHGLDEQRVPLEAPVPAVQHAARGADATWVAEVLAWHGIGA